jgi:hypothetical protein
MKLIGNWTRAYRLDTVQAAAALAVLSAIQLEVLPLLEPLLPAAYWPWASLAFAVVILLLRLRAQPGVLDGGAPTPDKHATPPQAKPAKGRK